MFLKCDDTRRKALLSYQAGSEIVHQLEDFGTDAEYETARDKLTTFVESQKNQRFEVCKFRQTRQDKLAPPSSEHRIDKG